MRTQGNQLIQLAREREGQNNGGSERFDLRTAVISISLYRYIDIAILEDERQKSLCTDMNSGRGGASSYEQELPPFRLISRRHSRSIDIDIDIDIVEDETGGGEGNAWEGRGG